MLRTKHDNPYLKSAIVNDVVVKLKVKKSKRLIEKYAHMNQAMALKFSSVMKQTKKSFMDLFASEYLGENRTYQPSQNLKIVHSYANYTYMET